MSPNIKFWVDSPGNNFLEVTAIFWSCHSFAGSHWGWSQNMKFVLIFCRQHSALSADSIRLNIVAAISFWWQMQNLNVTSRKLFTGPPKIWYYHCLPIRKKRFLTGFFNYHISNYLFTVSSYLFPYKINYELRSD